MIYAAAVGALILLSLLAYAFRPDGTRQFGRFEGRVVADWNDDGRNMTLTQDFTYIDPRSIRWFAPRGSVINGASIPRPFWSITGGPFEGKFRNASVVHDVACIEMSQTWEAVHRMFYDACRCGGVEETKAKLLYYAVYNYGPRWEQVTTKGWAPSDASMAPTTPVRQSMPEPSAEEVQRAIAYFDHNNPSIEAIESLRLDGGN